MADSKNHLTAPGDSMEGPLIKEYKQDRVLRALQVVAITGFVKTAGSTQSSCLTLCNTCREHVPADCLTISHGVPPSILAVVCPDVQPAGSEHPSRVLPPRRALKVHWTFDDLPSRHRLEEEEVQEEDAGGEGQSVDDRKTDHTADVNVDISSVRWPEGTREIALCSFNRTIEAMTLPEGLERLWFGQAMLSLSMVHGLDDIFNMTLDGATFPAGLREVFFGGSFNEPIDGVAWPGGLERLSLPGFNRSIRDVQWPPGLKALEFVSPPITRMWNSVSVLEAHEFPSELIDAIRHPNLTDSKRGHGISNQPLGTSLPPSLETLWLSTYFHQPFHGVTWPSGLVMLGLAFDFNRYEYPGSVTWPSSLQDLFMVNTPDEGMVYPQGSTVTILRTLEGSEALRGFGIDCYDPGEDPNDSQDYLEEYNDYYDNACYGRRAPFF